jgi:hypothetical protein
VAIVRWDRSRLESVMMTWCCIQQLYSTIRSSDGCGRSQVTKLELLDSRWNGNEVFKYDTDKVSLRHFLVANDMMLILMLHGKDPDSVRTSPYASC